MNGSVQITGEVVLPSYVPNARNAAAGLLNVKDIKEFRERSQDLVFVAYDIQFENDYSDYEEIMMHWPMKVLMLLRPSTLVTILRMV